MSTLAIPATVATVVALSEIDSFISGKGFQIKPLIGGFLLGLGLFALSGLNPQLGTLFGVLIVVNAMIEHGLPVFTKLGGLQK